MDKLVKLSIIFGALLISFSALYYFFYFLPNIEKQELNLQKTQIQNEKQTQQQKLLQDQQQKQTQQSLLDSCLSDAQQNWLDWGKHIAKDADECKTNGGGICYTAQAFIDAYNQNDTQLQQDKDNCFKQYPQ